MTENQVSYKIRGAIFDAYNTMGPGLFETVYVAALAHLLKKEGLKVEVQKNIPVVFDGEDLGIGFKADLWVEDKVIVEVKSLKELDNVHFKQLITYLKLSNLKLGLLVNFNCTNINENIFRKVNGL